MLPGIQLPQLPPAPPGTQYRTRHIVESHPTKGRRTDKPKGVYCTTGVFDLAAANAKGAALLGCPVLILDLDVCDFLAPNANRQTRDAVKSALYALDDKTLMGYLEQQKDALERILAAVNIPRPTALVISGYGLHAYFWIDGQAGFGAQGIQTAVRANSGLISIVNKQAGFVLADPVTYDTGTRILRVPETYNNKGDKPRKVQVGYTTKTRISQETLFWLATHSTVDGAPESATQPQFGHLPKVQLPESINLPAPNTSGIADVVSSLPERQAERLRLVLQSCPFFLWATENPTELGRESWRGAATNIAAIAGEAGREAFHDFSRLDVERYDQYATDVLYSDAIESARDVGPMTYATLANNGDWPGPAQQPHKAPAAFRFDPVVEATGLLDLALDSKGRPLRTKGNLRKLLRQDEKYGVRIRWNLASQIVEHDGQPITDPFFGEVQEHLEDMYGLPFRKDMVADALEEISYGNKYHPVAAYLRSLKWDGKSRIAELLNDVLQVADPTGMYFEYLKCFLISAVARGLCEDAQGVQVDTVLVLHGEQGVKKSTFFRVLAKDWYNATEIKIGDKDALIAMSAAWFVEWQELERVLRRNPEGAKSFITRQVDQYRRPYARTEIRAPRRSIICATTNAPDFLSADPTGSRRYHVISLPYKPHERRVNIKRLVGIRDQLWAEAVARFDRGEIWYLTPAQASVQEQLNNEFSAELPWQGIIQRWILSRESDDIITTEAILSAAVQKPAEQWGSKDFHTVRSVMRAMGWKSDRRMVTSKDALTGVETKVRKYVWVPDARSPLLRRAEKPIANPPNKDLPANVSKLASLADRRTAGRAKH